MNYNKKRGFTIVELVIVIAVIAILAAVLIPTFSGLVDKSYDAKYKQLVAELNTGVATHTEQLPTMHDVVNAIKEMGIDITKYTLDDGAVLLYHAPSKTFLYRKDGVVFNAAGEDKTTAYTKTDLWLVTANTADLTSGYSIYWAGADQDTVSVSTGFDAGSTNIGTINYANSGAAQSVVIRTNGGALNIDAANDTVSHYDAVDNVKIVAVAGNSYHEYGSVTGNLTIVKGRVELTDKATVGTVVVSAENSEDVKLDVSTNSQIGVVATTTEAGKDVINSTTNIPEDKKNTEVVDQGKLALFAGGIGTKENPYLIATDEQFANIQQLADANGFIYGNFKLVDDVRYEGVTMDYLKNVDFDGDGHKLTFDGSNASWPSLFAGTVGDCSFRNLSYECKSILRGLIAYANGYMEGNYIVTKQEYTTLFENITVTSANNSNILTPMYGTSAFTYIAVGTTYFKNCVAAANYRISGATSYGGIFVGNFPQEAYISFENCINKGNVNGAYVGFFTGNDTRKIELTESATPVYGEKISYIYIKNCQNEGTIIGANSVAAFGCNGSQYKEESIIADKSLTEAKFIRGSMVVGGIEVSLTVDHIENTVKINGSDDTRVDHYELTYYAGISYGESGSGRFSYSVVVSKEDVANNKLFATATIMSKSDFVKNGGDYDSIGEEQLSGQFNYKVKTNSDGTLTIVVNVDDHELFDHFNKTEYAISACTKDGVNLGYNTAK